MAIGRHSTTTREGACILAERMRKAVAAACPWRPITVSIGTSTLAAGSHDAALLVAAADKALYAAKQVGRNRVAHADCAAA